MRGFQRIKRDIKNSAFEKEEKDQDIGNLIFLIILFSLLVVTYYFGKIEIGFSIVLFIVLVYNTVLSYELRSIDQQLYVLYGRIDDIQSLALEMNDILKNLQGRNSDSKNER